MKKWKKVGTKSIHQFGGFYRVEVDEVITPGGKEGEYSVVRMNPFCIIIPISDNGTLYFVKQHRYTTDQFVIELPMGNTDGENPLEAAKRELEEETGLISDDWEAIGIMQVANGYSELYAHVYIARGVKNKENYRKDPLDENLFEVLSLSFDEARAMIANGNIDECDSIAALGKAFFSGKI